jgi:thiamine pyrophosphokinase
VYLIFMFHLLFLSFQILNFLYGMEYDTVMIANGHIPPIEIINSYLEGRKIIAVDGGLNYCYKNGITPHLITGDFDSATHEALHFFKSVEKIETPDQNKTDLEKALELVGTEGGVAVFGATGKRLDHTISNLMLLHKYPQKVYYVDEHGHTFSIVDSCSLSLPIGTTLSFFSLMGEAKEVTTKGLKWDLDKATLSQKFFSISNVTKQETVSLYLPDSSLLVTIIDFSRSASS